MKIENLKEKFDKQFIDQLNMEINDILSKIFNDDFKLVISSTVETKTTKNIKKEIAFVINANDRETDIRGISGGEADRISLSLTIALANMWNSRFILIDESMKSLDDETRRNCIEVLRSTGKPCVCISHSDISGMYDYEINLQS